MSLPTQSTPAAAMPSPVSRSPLAPPTTLPTPIARAPLALLLVTGAIIFLANAGLLVLQLLAGRYLAPFIGSSVETWTSVIGVFLTGIALGNWVGGRIADRYPSTRTLALLLIVGGLSCLAPVGGMLLCEQTGFYSSIPLGPRIPILAALFCLLPATVLSMITPLVIKLAMADVRRAGRVAGVNFALSTLGCLLGNYLTGFWLMAAYRLDTIAFGVTAALVLAGVLQAVANWLGQEPKLHRIEDGPALPTAKSADEPEEDTGLNLRDNIRRVYAVVFVASFCGMSLELTGSRVLAPILGVSLYTWTGIIGVMLAGTAVGNYLGGVLADRGVGAALQRFAVIAGGLVGVCMAGPAYESLLSLNGGVLPASLEKAFSTLENWLGAQRIWLVRAVGVLAGVAVALVGVALGRRRWGWWVNVAAVGGFVGAVLAYTIGRQFSKFLNLAWFTRFHEGLSDQIGFDTGPFLVHGLGFALGAALTVMLVPRPAELNRPARSTILATSLLLGSLATLAVLMSLGILQHSDYMMKSLALVDKVLAWTFALFFAPMLMLGTISPQVIRLSVKDVRHAGRTAGSVYAWSTAGAIAGTFVTGYFLIGSVGTVRVLMLVALVVAVLAFVVGKLWRNSAMLFAVSIVAGGATIGWAIKGFDGPRSYDLETKYYAISVEFRTKEFDDGRKRELGYLSLDHLIHSYVDLSDPTYLGYKHEEVQGELLRLARDRALKASTPTNLLVIGGGGYTFPRWVENQLPDVNVEVVEIDPGVTEIAHRKLGLPRDTKIRTINMDGRQYVNERAPKGHYQLVMQDAVNDFSVPFHLMTKEYNDAIARLLTPDGAYLLTLIDDMQYGKLWRAAAHTMKKTFPNVYFLAPDDRWDYDGRAVFILYGSAQPFSLKEVEDSVNAAWRAKGGDPKHWTHVMPDKLFGEMINTGLELILTDQYAPVDNLMADVFLNNSPK